MLTYIDALMSALSIYLPILAAYSYPMESKLLMLVAVTPFSHCPGTIVSAATLNTKAQATGIAGGDAVPAVLCHMCKAAHV